jgi:hypothetical protein
LAPHFALHFAPHLAPHFAPHLAPHLALHLAPHFALHLSFIIPPWVCEAEHLAPHFAGAAEWLAAAAGKDRVAAVSAAIDRPANFLFMLSTPGVAPLQALFIGKCRKRSRQMEPAFLCDADWTDMPPISDNFFKFA